MEDYVQPELENVRTSDKIEEMLLEKISGKSDDSVEAAN
jgi:hypothetical protein